MLMIPKSRIRHSQASKGSERDRCRAILESDFSIPVKEGSVCDRLPRLMLAEVQAMKNGSNAKLSCNNANLIWSEVVTVADGKIYEVIISTTPRHPFSLPLITVRPNPSFITKETVDKNGRIVLASRYEYAGKMSVLDLRNKIINFLNQTKGE